MRLKIDLEASPSIQILPIDYQYAMSTAIYRIIGNGSQEIANWKYHNGLSSLTGKKVNLFNFSWLSLESYKIVNDSIHSFGGCSFKLSSPVEPELVGKFIHGINKCPEITINHHRYEAKFRIKVIEEIKPKSFGNHCTFRAISPITVSALRDYRGELKIHYFRVNEEGFTEAIKKNLIRKHRILFGKEYEGDLEITIPYPEKAASKLIHFKAGTAEEYRVKSFFCDIEVKGSQEIMEALYCCGAGEKNSTGFGMVELKKTY